MFQLNIFMKKEGNIWQRREKSTLQNGVLLSIFNNGNDLPMVNSRQGRIISAAIEYPRLVTGDVHGQMYLFNFSTNRFKSLNKIDSCCTAIAFANSLYPDSDILVASAQCFLYIIKSKTSEVIAKLTGHNYTINHISVDTKGYVAVTSSCKETIVWDMQRLDMKYQISLSSDLDLVKSLLVPTYEKILSIYKKEKILFWGHTQSEKDAVYYEIGTKRGEKDFVVTTADISRDGRFLLLGGKTNCLLCCQIDSLSNTNIQPLVISLCKEFKVVLKLVFVNVSFQESEVIYLALVLNQDGVLYMYEIFTNKMIKKISLLDDKIINMHCSLDSDKIVVVTAAGLAKVYVIEKLVFVRDFSNTSSCKLIKQSAVNTAEAFEESVVEEHFKEERCSKKISAITLARLRGSVKEFGKFPEKYRLIIWSNFLGTPDDSDVFKSLHNKEIHEAYKNLEEKYPVVSVTLLRNFKTVLSMLAYWCPRLVEISSIPNLVFPFVKLLHFNLHLCLEIVISVLCTFSSNWFVHYPLPNRLILITSEKLLKEHDKDLLLHFIKCGISSQIYAWSIMKILLSGVFYKQEWVQLMDHLVANSSDFLLYVVISFNIVLRKVLLNCHTSREFEGIFVSTMEKSVLVDMLNKAYTLYHCTSFVLKEEIKNVVGVKHSVFAKGYPIFDNFPDIVIDMEKEKQLALEELSYMKTRQELLLNQQSSEIKAQNLSKFNSQTFNNGACANVNMNDNMEEKENSPMPPEDVVRRGLNARSRVAKLQQNYFHRI